MSTIRCLRYAKTGGQHSFLAITTVTVLNNSSASGNNVGSFTDNGTGRAEIGNYYTMPLDYYALCGTGLYPTNATYPAMRAKYSCGTDIGKSTTSFEITSYNSTYNDTARIDAYTVCDLQNTAGEDLGVLQVDETEDLAGNPGYFADCWYSLDMISGNWESSNRRMGLSSMTYEATGRYDVNFLFPLKNTTYCYTPTANYITSSYNIAARYMAGCDFLRKSWMVNIDNYDDGGVRDSPQVCGAVWSGPEPS
jgi:hypothetical protein